MRKEVFNEILLNSSFLTSCTAPRPEFCHINTVDDDDATEKKHINDEIAKKVIKF